MKTSITKNRMITLSVIRKVDQRPFRKDGKGQVFYEYSLTSFRGWRKPITVFIENLSTFTECLSLLEMENSICCGQNRMPIHRILVLIFCF